MTSAGLGAVVATGWTWDAGLPPTGPASLASRLQELHKHSTVPLAPQQDLQHLEGAHMPCISVGMPHVPSIHTALLDLGPLTQQIAR